MVDRETAAVLDVLRGMGLRTEIVDAGYNLPEAGFALYAPGKCVEAVSVYRRGYYD